MEVIQTSQQSYSARPQLPALTGIRFFAIFHIFLHHLWAVHHYLGGEGGIVEGIFPLFNDAPVWLISFMANGWVSTSLFFLLSGFMLGWLYWDEQGGLRGSKKRFWLLRFARIYPVHLLVLVILLGLKMPGLIAEGQSMLFLLSSAIATGLLVQAWVPQWIPPWNWPAWTISVLAFLYLLMPYLLRPLSRLSADRRRLWLGLMPVIAVIPGCFYVAVLNFGVPWSGERERLFSNNPLVWLPWFIAGLLLSRLVKVNDHQPAKASLVAWGDLALLLVLAISLVNDISWYLIPFIKFGLLMPLYFLVVRDLALGNGLFARLYSLPLLRFLGDAGFSIFIWQSVIMTLAFMSLHQGLSIGPHQFWVAVVLILAIAIASNHLLEKPMARWIRRRTSAVKRNNQSSTQGLQQE